MSEKPPQKAANFVMSLGTPRAITSLSDLANESRGQAGRALDHRGRCARAAFIRLSRKAAQARPDP